MRAATPHIQPHRGEWKKFCSPHLFISHPARGQTSMQFSSSLKLNHIFRRLYARGARAANRYLVLYCLKNGTQHNRIGLTVSAKLAGAVGRNRLRRQLREIYRLHEGSFCRGYDLVVVARTGAIGAPYAALEHAYLSLAERLKLLGGDCP